MKSTADKNRSRDPINIVTVTQSLHSTLENFTYRQTGGVFTQLILAIIKGQCVSVKGKFCQFLFWYPVFLSFFL